MYTWIFMLYCHTISECFIRVFWVGYIEQYSVLISINLTVSSAYLYTLKYYTNMLVTFMTGLLNGQNSDRVAS